MPGFSCMEQPKAGKTYIVSFPCSSKMAITDTPVLKRGQGYTVKAGQVDGSILGLSKEWEIGRKATTRLLENFSNLGIIKVESNPLTSIITTMCIKEWMINKAMLANPCFSTTAKGTP